MSYVSLQDHQGPCPKVLHGPAQWIPQSPRGWLRNYLRRVQPPINMAMGVMFLMKFGHGENSGAEVGEQAAFMQLALLQGVEMWEQPRKEALLRLWGFTGRWDLRTHQKEEPGLGSRPLFLSGLLTGSRLPLPIFLVLCWEVGGRAHSAQPACLQVAPMRSSSTPSF